MDSRPCQTTCQTDSGELFVTMSESKVLYADKESVGPAEHPTTTNSYLITTPAGATSSAANGLVSHVANEGGTGRGEVNYAATWDEFPNGRFGDANSPAFGSQDLWGGYGRIVSARCL
jgi:hypothetical protein